MLNTSIGKYKILRLIGEGGMATVYEAEHEILATRVAIKVLNPILSANSQIRERFKNEAKIMASLNHPNIIKVIDFEEQPQQLSIVLELLEGEDLDEKMKKKGPLNDKEISNIFTETLSAFEYAHSKGIVHRDIKPANIYILPNGSVRILDFGIAKLFGQGNEMTQTGTQMGTPIFMSPEQIKGEKSIDHRSDIYSLGVTLFVAVSGKAPYDSKTESQFDIFNKIVHEPLPEISGNGKFNQLIYKACNKDREQRFQSCEEWLGEMNNSVIKSPENSKESKVENATIDDLTNRLQIEIEPVSIVLDNKGNCNYLAIGTQDWMTTNLDVSTFRNGEPIPQVESPEEWQSAGDNQQAAWCYYDNDVANSAKYGKLYNWFAVNDLRGLAPAGYHIPTDTEWTKLSDYLGGDTATGGKMKNSSGWNDKGHGNDSSGFKGLPGGYRNGYGGFHYVGDDGSWWSTSESYGSYAWNRVLSGSNSYLYRSDKFKNCGFSVRCIKD